MTTRNAVALALGTALLAGCSHQTQHVRRWHRHTAELRTYVLPNGTYYGYDADSSRWYTAFNDSSSPDAPMSRTSLENPEFPRPLGDTITWVRAQTPPPAEVRSARDGELDAEGAEEDDDTTGTRIDEATKSEEDAGTTTGTD